VKTSSNAPQVLPRVKQPTAGSHKPADKAQHGGQGHEAKPSDPAKTSSNEPQVPPPINQPTTDSRKSSDKAPHGEQGHGAKPLDLVKTSLDEPQVPPRVNQPTTDSRKSSNKAPYGEQGHGAKTSSKTPPGPPHVPSASKSSAQTGHNTNSSAFIQAEMDKLKAEILAGDGEDAEFNLSLTDPTPAKVWQQRSIPQEINMELAKHLRTEDIRSVWTAFSVLKDPGNARDMAELAASFSYVGEGPCSFEPVGGRLGTEHKFQTVEIDGRSMGTTITAEQTAWALNNIPANITRLELIDCDFITIRHLEITLKRPSLKSLKLIFVRGCSQLVFGKLLKIAPIVAGGIKLDFYISTPRYSLTKQRRSWKVALSWLINEGASLLKTFQPSLTERTTAFYRRLVAILAKSCSEEAQSLIDNLFKTAPPMVLDKEGYPIFPEERQGVPRTVEADDDDEEDVASRGHRIHVDYWHAARALMKFVHELWHGRKLDANSNAAKEFNCFSCDHVTFGTLFSKGDLGRREDAMSCDYAKFTEDLETIYHGEHGKEMEAIDAILASNQANTVAKTPAVVSFCFPIQNCCLTMLTIP